MLQKRSFLILIAALALLPVCLSGNNQTDSNNCLNSIKAPINTAAIPNTFQAKITSIETAPKLILAALQKDWQQLPGYGIVDTILNVPVNRRTYFSRLQELNARALEAIENNKLNIDSVFFETLKSTNDSIIGDKAVNYTNDSTYAIQRIQLAANVARYLLDFQQQHHSQVFIENMPWYYVYNCGEKTPIEVLQDKLSNQEIALQNLKKMFNLFLILGGSVLGLLLLGLVYLFRQVNQLRSRPKKKSKTKKTAVGSKQQKTGAKTKDNTKTSGEESEKSKEIVPVKTVTQQEFDEALKQQKVAFNEKLNEALKQIEELKQNAGGARATAAANGNSEIITEAESDKATKTEETYKFLRVEYASPPNNGIFYKQTMSNVLVPKKHIYEIRVLTEDKASYDLVNDSESRNSAKNMADRFLFSAMDPIGKGDVKHTVFRTEPGELVRDGDHWKIDKRAKLIY